MAVDNTNATKNSGKVIVNEGRSNRNLTLNGACMVAVDLENTGLKKHLDEFIAGEAPSAPVKGLLSVKFASSLQRGNNYQIVYRPTTVPEAAVSLTLCDVARCSEDANLQKLSFVIQELTWDLAGSAVKPEDNVAKVRQRDDLSNLDLSSINVFDGTAFCKGALIEVICDRKANAGYISAMFCLPNHANGIGCLNFVCFENIDISKGRVADSVLPFCGLVHQFPDEEKIDVAKISEKDFQASYRLLMGDDQQQADGAYDEDQQDQDQGGDADA